MLKKGLCLFVGIMMLFCQINVVHATNLASGAESAILIDANSQQIISKKCDKKALSGIDNKDYDDDFIV
jgi:D-alanyl-D-alanine carboxypeptidase (penicillin-binding protein 5/6)